MDKNIISVGEFCKSENHGEVNLHVWPAGVPRVTVLEKV